MASISKGTLVHYAIGTAKFGPITQDELYNLYNQNAISLETKVWWQGLDSWIEYRWLYNNTYGTNGTQMPPLAPHLPPTLSHPVSNVIVWLIAFSPILGSIVGYFIAALLEEIVGRALSASLPTAITLGINVMLCYIDERKINEAGYDTEDELGSAWLIPVYLFKRAKFLCENNAYAIVWCVVFGLSILLGI